MADYYLSNGHNEEARQLFERLVSLDFFVPFFNRLLFVCFIDFLLQSSETGPDATVFFLLRELTFPREKMNGLFDFCIAISNMTPGGNSSRFVCFIVHSDWDRFCHGQGLRCPRLLGS